MTLSIEDRAALVLAEAWRLLPEIKHEAWISSITLLDLGSKHGGYSPDDGILTLSTRLFWGSNPWEIMYLDIDGNTPPFREPYTSRALHTACHEFGHAICAALGLDTSKDWLALSGWVNAADDPQDTARYHELRPGWGGYISDWRHDLGKWWARDYSRRSPFEDAADCIAHIALGWNDFVSHPIGQAKMRYIARHVWRQAPQDMLRASSLKWRRRLQVRGIGV